MIRVQVNYDHDKEEIYSIQSGRKEEHKKYYIQLKIPLPKGRNLNYKSSLDCIQGDVTGNEAETKYRVNQPSQGGPYVSGYRIEGLQGDAAPAMGDYVYTFERRQIRGKMSDENDVRAVKLVYWKHTGKSRDCRIECAEAKDNPLFAPPTWKLIQGEQKIYHTQNTPPPANVDVKKNMSGLIS